MASWRIPYVPGANLYVVCARNDGKWWNFNADAAEDYNGAHAAYYELAATEFGTGTGLFDVSFSQPGTWAIFIYDDDAGIPVGSIDTVIASDGSEKDPNDQVANIDGKTDREAMRIMAAVLAGKTSGVAEFGPNTEIYKGLDGSTARATITVDETGNRTATTYG